MKTEVTTTVKISVKGVDLELTADEARELAKAITDALKPAVPVVPTEPYGDKMEKLMDEMRKGRVSPAPYHPPFHYQPTPPWNPLEITCATQLNAR